MSSVDARNVSWIWALSLACWWVSFTPLGSLILLFLKSHESQETKRSLWIIAVTHRLADLLLDIHNMIVLHASISGSIFPRAKKIYQNNHWSSITTSFSRWSKFSTWKIITSSSVTFNIVKLIQSHLWALQNCRNNIKWFVFESIKL